MVFYGIPREQRGAQIRGDVRDPFLAARQLETRAGVVLDVQSV